MDVQNDNGRTSHFEQPDHDRVVRIEMAVEHIREKLLIHMEELRAHIRDETADFRSMREALQIHLREAKDMMADLDAVKKDVSKLKYERVRLLGWVMGVIFVVSIGWVVLGAWLDHQQQARHELERSATP